MDLNGDYERYDGLGLAGLVKDGSVSPHELLEAIASRMVPAAHATDGGGSIRIPASCCGLFGLKPSRARTPMGPEVARGEAAWSSRTPSHDPWRDTAALLDVTAGADIGDPCWAPPPKRSYQAEVGTDPGRLRIAFTTKPWKLHEGDSECVDAVNEAAKLCEDLGHYLEEASPSRFNPRRLLQHALGRSCLPRRDHH